jgi:hypothetical protein
LFGGGKLEAHAATSPADATMTANTAFGFIGNSS